MEQDLKSKIDLACKTAEEFTKHYYDTIDKKRYLVSKLYMDKGNLIWNGNSTEGKDNIQKFWCELPTSNHTMSTLDAQPVIDTIASDQLTILVKVGGSVKYQDKPLRPFNQNFLITAVAEKWKIVSDCFRMQETPGTTN